MSGAGFIAAEKPQQCDFCGKIEELRPYGPNREAICFECGKKDPETTEKMMALHLEGPLDKERFVEALKNLKKE